MAADIGRLLTAMITPFKADGAVDYEAAQRLAKLLTTSGSDGVVVYGTTGEAPALTDDEKVELCRIVKQAIPDKTVIAGAGSNSTQHSVHLTQASIKASGDMDQMGLVCAGKPTGFRVWSGDDSFTLPLLAVGGYGVICVVSHIAGPAMKAMIEAFLKGDHERAASIHQGLLPVIKALMTTASNPIPIKTAINRLGFPAGPFRLPLAPLADGDGDRLMGVIK